VIPLCAHTTRHRHHLISYSDVARIRIAGRSSAASHASPDSAGSAGKYWLGISNHTFRGVDHLGDSTAAEIRDRSPTTLTPTSATRMCHIPPPPTF
jgi:hypothetical protein